MPVDDPFDMDWPDFDKSSKCVKCGFEIAEPEPVPEKPELPGAAKPVAKKPAAKPEKAAEEGPAKKPMQLPVQAPDPTCAYCNGEKCPAFDEEVPEHMHQYCDCCGYEWIAKTLDASKDS